MPSSSAPKKNSKSPQQSKKKVEKSEKSDKSVKKVEPVVESVKVEPVVETQVEEKKDSIVESLSSLLTKFEVMEKESRNARNEVRKVLKAYQKKASKGRKRKVDPNRTPSGFAKPALISNDLCKFLGKDNGSFMARTDVTKEVNKYIKEHNLQNPANKKEIKPDPILCKLLNIKKDDNLTYFSLQKFLKDHFPKVDTSVKA
jgi:upstream activation factor subunit UAF30